MSDYKQKVIRIFVFSIVFLSLLTNLAYFSYEKVYQRGDFTARNNEIINNYKNNYPDISIETRQQTICSKLVSPLGSVVSYYRLVFVAGSLILISILVIVLILIAQKIKKVTLSRSYLFSLGFIEMLSISVFIWAFMSESDYYYTYCVKFL